MRRGKDLSLSSARPKGNAAKNLKWQSCNPTDRSVWLRILTYAIYVKRTWLAPVSFVTELVIHC
jgi:hypothetical protein